MSTEMTTRNIYTIEEVARHNTEDDCWIILGNETNGGKKVYNVTQFLSEHPGGREIILDFAGKDADSVFEDIGHSTTARKILNAYLIGILQTSPIVKSVIIEPPTAKCDTEPLTSEVVDTGATVAPVDISSSCGVPDHNFIPLESLSFEDAIDLLISLGCAKDLQTRLESLRGEFDGGFLYHIKDDEEFAIECQLSDLRKPTIRKIFSQLESFKRDGISEETISKFRSIRAEFENEIIVRFRMKINSFPGSYASIVLARVQPSIPNNITKDWSYTFYLFGSNSAPNKAGEFGVSCAINGNLDLRTKIIQLQPGHEYDIIWEYGIKGSHLTATDTASGEVIRSSMDWSGHLHIPPESVVHVNKLIYSGGGRNHSVLDGTISEVFEKIRDK